MTLQVMRGIPQGEVASQMTNPPNDKIVPFSQGTPATPSGPASRTGFPQRGAQLSFGGLKKIQQKPKLTGLQARLAEAKKAEQQNESNGCSGNGGSPETRSNRLALILDCSGSMDGERMESLKKATESFLQCLSLGPQGDTSIACETFPPLAGASYPLTIDFTKALLSAWALDTTGCTPMAEAMELVITKYPITRGILMSDGQPDSETKVFDQARRFAEAELPIDCVHISSCSAGEACLQQVAELTGGLFIKFTDLDSFVKSFKYLSPKLRPLMLSGRVGAEELGATSLLGQGGAQGKGAQK